MAYILKNVDDIIGALKRHNGELTISLDDKRNIIIKPTIEATDKLIDVDFSFLSKDELDQLLKEIEI